MKALHIITSTIICIFVLCCTIDSKASCHQSEVNLLLNQAQVHQSAICLDTFPSSFGGGYVELWGNVYNPYPDSVLHQSWVNVTTNDTLTPSSTSGWYIAPDTVQTSGTYVYTLVADSGCVYKDSLTIYQNCTSQPDAIGDTVTVCSDTSSVIDVLQNDNPSNGYINITNSPQHGTAVVTTPMNISYDPDSGFTGLDILTYGLQTSPSGPTVDMADVFVQVQSCGGAGSNCPGNANILLNQVQVDHNQICLDTFQSSFGGGYVELWGNVYNPYPDSVYHQSWVNVTTNDTLTPSSTSGWYIAPDTVQSSSTYVYTLVADSGCVYKDTLTLLKNCNNQPQAVNDSATLCQDSSVVIDVRQNDGYSNNYFTTYYNNHIPPQHGSITINSQGEIIYYPDSGFTGTDEFVYGISQSPSGPAIDTARVFVEVQPCGNANCQNFTADLLINQHPAHQPKVCLDTFPGNTNIQLWGGIPSNYPDSLITHQHWVSVDSFGGSVDTLHGTFPGSSWYIANAHVNHKTHYIYTVVAADGCVYQDTLTLDVGCQSQSHATDDNVVTCAGQPLLIDVRDNDTYGPQHATTVTGMQPPAHGSVTVLNQDKILFEPDSAYIGIDSFHYGITDTNNPNNIIDTAGVVVHVEPCANDSVWPGDANDNGVANLYDVLNIGMAHGASAFPRPNSSTSWTPQPCPNWNASFNSGVNYKHADCDGDGVIDSFDVDVVDQNYGLTHSKMAYPDADPSDPSLEIEMDKDTVDQGQQIQGSILLGNSGNTVSDVYGVAFSVNYNPSLLAPNTLNLNFPGSWMGTPSTTIDLVHPLPSNNSVDAAYSRTNQVNVSGGGQLARIDFYIQDNIIGKKSTPLYLTISNVKLIRKDGSEIPVNAIGDTVTIEGRGTGLKDQPGESQFTIYPNPVNDYAIIKTGNEQKNKQIQVRNVLGQTVLKKDDVKQSSIRISTSGLESGVYFVTVTSDGDRRTEKMTISR